MGKRIVGDSPEKVGRSRGVAKEKERNRGKNRWTGKEGEPS